MAPTGCPRRVAEVAVAHSPVAQAAAHIQVAVVAHTAAVAHIQVVVVVRKVRRVAVVEASSW